MAVEFGLVDGHRPTTTPTGQPISTMPRASSRCSTPTVGMSRMDSQTALEANSILICLCAAMP